MSVSVSNPKKVKITYLRFIFTTKNKEAVPVFGTTSFNFLQKIIF